jgi:hypothetical protein
MQLYANRIAKKNYDRSRTDGQQTNHQRNAVWVSDIPELLASGMTNEEVLEDFYPEKKIIKPLCCMHLSD